MSSKNGQGFTLVETLTVIAIIAVVASVGFTLSAPSREKARQVVCGQQLRQLHAAVMMYSSDVGAAEEIPGLGELSRIPLYGLKVLDPYLKDSTIRDCPDFPASLKGVLASTYVWWPAHHVPGDSAPEAARTERQRQEIAKVGTSFPMWVCGTHDEVFYRPSERHVNPMIAEPFIVEISVAGSLFSGRRPYPGSNIIAAALSLSRS